jgi:hypothetical protein
MKLSVRFDSQNRSPLKVIKWIISIVSIVGGLYVMSPLLVYSTATFGAGALSQTIANPVGIFTFGLLFFASGALLAVGLIWDKKTLRAYGLFANILLRIYSLIGTWLTVGFLPLSWLSNFALIMIAIVVYLAVRWEQKKEE